MKPLIEMWRHPRLVAWFLITTLLTVLVRLPFFKAPIVPQFVDFHPGIVLVPLSAVFWGPAGALGSMAGTLIADWLTAMWTPISGFKAVGILFFALSSKRIWDAIPPIADTPGGHASTWRATLRFLICSLPGICIAAMLPAWGCESAKLYPFTYIATLIFCHHILWVSLLGVALYRALAREMVPQFGTWRDVMDVDQRIRPVRGWGVLAQVVGGVGGLAASMLLSGWTFKIWPNQIYMLGSYTAPPVLICAGVGVVIFLVGLLWRQPATPPSRTSIQVELGL